MKGKIFFVGGIHGVGKSTICLKICKELDLDYLSASTVLKWNELNKNPQNKKVQDVSYTQDRLLTNLHKVIKPDKFYLLDGHYCLLDNSETLIKIPIEVFEQINPISLSVVVGNIDEIKNRIEKRDNRKYNRDLLTLMQKYEMDHALEIARKLEINLSIGSSTDYFEIASTIRTQLFRI